MLSSERASGPAVPSGRRRRSMRKSAPAGSVAAKVSIIFAQRDPEHLAAFPDAQRPKIFRGHRIASDFAQIFEHGAVAARRGTNLGIGKPEQYIWLPHQSRRADAGNGKEMQERRFAERKLF